MCHAVGREVAAGSVCSAYFPEPAVQAREERTVAPKTHKIIFSPSIWRGDDRTKAASQTLAFAKRLDQRLRRHWGIVLKRHLELLLHPVVSSFARARLPLSIPYRRAEKSRIERQASLTPPPVSARTKRT